MIDIAVITVIYYPGSRYYILCYHLSIPCHLVPVSSPSAPRSGEWDGMRGDKGRWVRDERKHNWRVSDVPFSPRHLRFLIPSLHLSLHQVLQLQPCNTLNLLSTFTSLSFPSVHVTSPYGSLSERNERYRREVNDVKWARRTWKQRLGPLRFSSHLLPFAPRSGRPSAGEWYVKEMWRSGGGTVTHLRSLPSHRGPSPEVTGRNRAHSSLLSLRSLRSSCRS